MNVIIFIADASATLQSSALQVNWNFQNVPGIDSVQRFSINFNCTNPSMCPNSNVSIPHNDCACMCTFASRLQYSVLAGNGTHCYCRPGDHSRAAGYCTCMYMYVHVCTCTPRRRVRSFASLPLEARY